MKKILLPIIVMLLAGCDYEIPLSQTPSAPANPALAGIWAGKSTDEKSVSLEIKTSGTEYLVTYAEGGDLLSFKGHEIKVTGLSMIQLELQDTDKSKYLFAKYELTPDGLSIHRLNTEVISAKCQTTEELLKDIDVHRNNPFLFSEPLKFTKSAQQ